MEQYYNFTALDFTIIQKRIYAVELENYIPAFDFSESEIAIAMDSSGLKVYKYED